MGKRKNLSDAIHGDRAEVRGYKLPKVVGDQSEMPFTGSGYGLSWYKGSGKGYKSGHSGHVCYLSHPPLKLPGTELVIYGGSCSQPKIDDADVYIGFDFSMKMTPRSWPWKKTFEFLFEIQDMGVPKEPEEFKKLVGWTRKRLEEGSKVHCGCIGGHGRTGMFLAALTSTFGEKDAITYVRGHYCKKAVESLVQVEFLHKHFGIVKVKGAKEYSGSNKSSTGRSVADDLNVTAMQGNGSIWG